MALRVPQLWHLPAQRVKVSPHAVQAKVGAFLAMGAHGGCASAAATVENRRAICSQAQLGSGKQ
jgi:hypothetical protein